MLFLIRSPLNQLISEQEKMRCCVAAQATPPQTMRRNTTTAASDEKSSYAVSEVKMRNAANRENRRTTIYGAFVGNFRFFGTFLMNWTMGSIVYGTCQGPFFHFYKNFYDFLTFPTVLIPYCGAELSLLCKKNSSCLRPFVCLCVRPSICNAGWLSSFRSILPIFSDARMVFTASKCYRLTEKYRLKLSLFVLCRPLM